MGALNVLECAAKVGARKVVYAASGGTIYGEPRRLPAKESAAQASHPAEPLRHLEEGGRSTTSGSSSATAGSTSRRCALGERLRAAAGSARRGRRRVDVRLGKMLAGEAPTIYGDGNQTRDYVFIDDVVHAFVQAIDRGSAKVVNIGTGLETSVNGLYRLLADIIGFAGEPRARTAARRASSDAACSTSPPRPPRSRGSRGRTSRTAWPRRSRS